MNYIGSKSRLSVFLKEEISKVVEGELIEKIFCDIFAGTGIVGRSFKRDVKKVISNDLENYSFVLNKNYIENSSDMDEKQRYIDELNALNLRNDGFIYQNYCLGGSGKRQYFSDKNGKKIDTVRLQIKEWYENKTIDENMFYFLLASLLESADKVANTASMYGAYLKHLKKTAQKEMILESAHFETAGSGHRVYNEDANELIRKIEGDILYLDPPYNHREYGANYHLLNTIALYDEFEPRGKSGLREYKKSRYCKKKYVHNTFEELIKYAKFKYIFLSYNNEGLMSEKDVKEIMSKYGKYDLATTEYKRFKADKTEKRNHRTGSTFEYLHILQKDGF
ncbi:DNA adenine methylase [Sulfurimonas sp. HSL-1716]|uniref:DNA adenine methylase n=1 Tax=Hydrocurvibacter sulfurireducens TaxID=3131937 RepID=UPI0031F8F26D